MNRLITADLEKRGVDGRAGGVLCPARVVAAVIDRYLMYIYIDRVDMESVTPKKVYRSPVFLFRHRPGRWSKWTNRRRNPSIANRQYWLANRPERMRKTMKRKTPAVDSMATTNATGAVDGLAADARFGTIGYEKEDRLLRSRTTPELANWPTRSWMAFRTAWSWGQLCGSSSSSIRLLQDVAIRANCNHGSVNVRQWYVVTIELIRSHLHPAVCGSVYWSWPSGSYKYDRGPVLTHLIFPIDSSFRWTGTVVLQKDPFRSILCLDDSTNFVRVKEYDRVRPTFRNAFQWSCGIVYERDRWCVSTENQHETQE